MIYGDGYVNFHGLLPQLTLSVIPVQKISNQYFSLEISHRGIVLISFFDDAGD